MVRSDSAGFHHTSLVLALPDLLDLLDLMVLYVGQMGLRDQFPGITQVSDLSISRYWATSQERHD